VRGRAGYRRHDRKTSAARRTLPRNVCRKLERVALTEQSWGFELGRLFGAKFARKNSRILAHDRTRLALAEIPEFVRRSRHAKTFNEHVELQRDLAKYALDIYGFDKQVVRRMDTLRSEIPTAKAAGDLERVRNVSAILREYRDALEANKRRWSALRLVQDGIVWRTIQPSRYSTCSNMATSGA
jgi:hypothetical protein